MSDSVGKYRVFVHALNTVKRIPRTGSARPPTTDRLKLYGLYKQSTEGDVEGLSPRPEGDDPDSVAERDKWDAWHSNASLTRTEAKRRYISTLISTMHQYATTTPEARELVSELEFVWDQIKSNTASSSAASSPGQMARTQAQQTTIDESGRGGSSGLRMLRPVSDRDEEEDDEADEDDIDEINTPHPAGFDAPISGTVSQTRDLDIRNRKWRKRIEKGLVRLSTEIAALREQVEAKRVGDGKRRNGVWAWMVWLVWVAVRHVLVDMAVLGVLLVWARRKRDGRVEVGVGLLVRYLRERVGRVVGPLRGQVEGRG